MQICTCMHACCNGCKECGHPQMNWISVKDRLANEFIESNDDLTHKSSTWVTTGKFSSDYKDWRYGEFDCEIKVTHWMPLPEPPHSIKE